MVWLKPIGKGWSSYALSLSSAGKKYGDVHSKMRPKHSGYKCPPLDLLLDHYLPEPAIFYFFHVLTFIKIIQLQKKTNNTKILVKYSFSHSRDAGVPSSSNSDSGNFDGIGIPSSLRVLEMPEFRLRQFQLWYDKSTLFTDLSKESECHFPNSELQHLQGQEVRSYLFFSTQTRAFTKASTHGVI